MSKKLNLQNTINQIKYIQNHQESLLKLDPDQYDRQVTKLSMLNQKLIDAFIMTITDKYTGKTVKKHQRNLTFFLNEYLAYHLETILGEEILDLEYPITKGFTTTEMRETKTALKKFYHFLLDQQLITTEIANKVVDTLNSQLTLKKIRQSLRKENEYLKKMVSAAQPVFSETTDELIKNYFAAFANLYGRISCDQAYRIICRQNPELKLASTKFVDLAERLTYQSDELNFLVDQSQAQPQIIHHTLLSHPDKLMWLSDQTMGMPFAILRKPKLLKYAENEYFEPSPSLKALMNFYQDVLEIPKKEIERYVKITVSIIRTWTDDKISGIYSTVNDALLDDGYGCVNHEMLEEFIQVLINLYNDTPRWALRGFAPSQSRMQTNAFELLNGQKNLNKRLIRLIKFAQVDPLKIVLYLLGNSNIDKDTSNRLQQQIINLHIPSLD
ncbi:hypothetical protein [uncultured Limosilactobacillus sp.]|uniref:hypothetical protein n=1 Tax=uncultured Limosilactobacillus sp. TaxID=2837629 RepID=UPI00265F25C7|nr:hypothetical protein [uncultured Limosilactobacillus sp.]